MSSWVTRKDKGKAAFERGDYELALSNYQAALDPHSHAPAAERQILLSNMVATRLKIGGPDQAEAAVENAKQCITLNDRWAKGHVRLASSFIALGGHSNDACNSLQKAIQLDPGHPTARSMLVRELRREKVGSGTPSGVNVNSSTDNPYEGSTRAATGSVAPEPSAPPADLDDHRASGNSANTATDNDTRPQTPFQNPHQDQPQPPHQNLDNDITWQDWFSFHFNRTKMWYLRQSDDVRTVLKVGLLLVALYFAFGGRFGLEGTVPGYRSQVQTGQRRGNYGSGNVYDQYYGRRTTEARQGDDQHHRNTYNRPEDTHVHDREGEGTGSTGSSSYHRESSSGRHDRDSHRQQQYSQDGSSNDNRYDSRSQRQRNTGSSFHLPNLFDGSIQSMLILAAIAYMCHRSGINPMQAIFFLQMMNGGGRRRHRGFGYGGGGMGMGGFGRRRW